MKTKNKKTYQIVLSVIALVLCTLSSSFAYSFLSSMPWPFLTRYLVGLLLMMTPTSVLWLIVELFRKDK